jgi:hypothetical protein
MSPTKTKEPPTAPSGQVSPARAGIPVPSLTPQASTMAPPATGPGGPTLEPPDTAAGLAAQAAVDGIGAWQSVTIGALWTSNHQSNAWAFLNGVGWRRISPANGVSHHAMLQILRVARDGNLTVQCDEDGSVLHTVYVW